MNRFYYNECFPDRTEKSRIKVEDINGDVLLLTPGYDDTWPSDQAAPRIMTVLGAHSFAHRYEHVVYEKGSHCLAMPESFLQSVGGEEKLQKMLARFLTMEKKYPAECKQARQDSWWNSFTNPWSKELQKNKIQKTKKCTCNSVRVII